MAKKFGINSKAEEGRAKKAEVKVKEKQKFRQDKEKIEEKIWSEGTKDEAKRQQEEAKRLEKLIKKQERKEMEENESKELEKYKASSNKTKSNLKDSEPLLRSKPLNWSLSISSDGVGSSETISEFTASNMDDALLLLESTNISSSSLSVEKHPERRMKAAFSIFEAREMPILRTEYPSLKHSQLLERLFKMWKKSPENPFNQLHVSHNVSQLEQTEIVKADQDQKLDRLRLN